MILTFVLVLADSGSMAAAPIIRADLARSQATAAPDSIVHHQVLEHAIRHLAWLAAEDQVVGATLDASWHAILSTYVPEPFQQLE